MLLFFYLSHGISTVLVLRMGNPRTLLRARVCVCVNVYL